MTDQLWINDDTSLSRKLIGTISSKKAFWNQVSDNDSHKKVNQSNSNGKKRNGIKSVGGKADKYMHLVDCKAKALIISKDKIDDIVKTNSVKGKTQNNLSFWENLVQEENTDVIPPNPLYTGKVLLFDTII